MADQKQQFIICDKRRPEAARAIRTILVAVNSSLDRANSVQDRNVRHTLLLDKLCIITDMLTALATTLPEDCGFERQFCDYIQNTATRVKITFEELFTFVQNPNVPPVVAPGPRREL